ncbi:HD domain-containing protein [Oceanirhabdus sp. W0125-5]|uniref:HD domain-containing protein n=1 Tax=Oceanirhabdus sp. W0125-5 TaxID=2999116 RepID=UPI0022F2B9E3|nr:HD domain-containing protein [Oceanirhabdus sp. W0125-5]WBW97600.1 HD domain-containing protein [Oceanirhabdus sp. W0125-5]
MIIRIKQFFRGVFQRVGNDEYKFIKKYLDSYELDLFNKLTSYEKIHAYTVAKKISDKLINQGYKDNIDRDRLIKAALLHDIGKIECAMNIIEKSIIVILDKFFRNKLKKSKSKKINIYYNHAEVGYNILLNKEYSEEFLNIIKFHHCDNVEAANKEEIQLLKQVDSQT